MYPYFELFWITIYMTWLAILVFILTNIFLIKFYSKRFNVNFWKFFNWLPLFIVLPYLLWSYFYYFFSIWLIIPLSLNDLLLIISPYWYNLSFIWISLWLFISIYIFLSKIEVKTEKLKRIDIFFYSISLSLVPLWMLLLLWDNFIWKPTSNFIWISAFLQDSLLYSYDKVYPVWLFLSFLWIVSFMIWLFFNYIFKRYWVGFFWFLVLIFLFNFVFHYQYYPKNLVLNLFNYTFDIKNYWTILISIWIILYYYNIKNFRG